MPSSYTVGKIPLISIDITACRTFNLSVTNIQGLSKKKIMQSSLVSSLRVGLFFLFDINVNVKHEQSYASELGKATLK